MASTTQDTQTMNTPHPYGSATPSTPGRSATEVHIPAPETHGVGTALGASKSSIGSGQNAPSQGKPTDQGSTQGQEPGQRQSGIVGGRKDTSGKEKPTEEEGGAARGSGTSATEGTDAVSGGVEPEGGYPEQKHAGKLDGYGPEYGQRNRVTLGDRLQGVKEEIKGSVKRDPELKKTGKERMTGELKHKQIEKERNVDPFKDEDGGEEHVNEREDEGESIGKNTRTEKMDEPGLTEHP